MHLLDLCFALFHYSTHADHLASFIGNLNANTVLARNRRDDADAGNTHRDSEVVGEGNDFLQTQSRLEIDLVHRDYRSRFDFDDAHLKSKLLARFLKDLCLDQCFALLLLERRYLGMLEQFNRRHLVVGSRIVKGRFV